MSIDGEAEISEPIETHIDNAIINRIFLIGMPFMAKLWSVEADDPPRSFQITTAAQGPVPMDMTEGRG
jgi:hypothetical protein